MVATNRVDGILHRCDELAQITDEPGGITRGFLSPAMRRVDEKMCLWMEQAGLRTETDAAGNRYGIRPCGRTDAPILFLGSHLDTVRNAGRYDGILGVLLALAAVERLGDAPLPFDVEVIAFSDEEGLRYGAPFLGSRAMLGDLDEALLARCDDQGVSMADAIRAWGGDPAEICRRHPDRRLLGYVEAHIEQGPQLEHCALPLGVLDAICSSAWLAASFQGHADHAGTTPMALRRDPLPAAAEAVLEAERLARDDERMVATVGRLEVLPGAGNVIPDRVEFSLDLRHPEEPSLEKSLEQWLDFCRETAEKRELRFEYEILSRQAALQADPRLSRILREAADTAGVDTCELICGAGHDALILSRIMPVTMLFLRSPGGISHHPDEAVLPEDVEAALEVLTATILRLAQEERNS